MKKGLPKVIASVVVIVIAVMTFIFLNNLPSTITGKPIWITETESNFSQGTFANTTVDASGVVFLNQTEIPDVYKDENLVALWHMNEGEGSVLHNEVSDDDLNLVDGDWISGKYGNAVNYSAVGHIARNTSMQPGRK